MFYKPLASDVASSEIILKEKYIGISDSLIIF